MALGLNYAEKYASVVDERFKLGSLTAGVVNDNFDWVGVSTVHVFHRDLATLGNYNMNGGMARYGTPSDLQNDVQDMVLSQDKAFTYIIDKKTAQDTMGTMEAAATLAENIDNVVIPALDTYRIAAIASGAPTSGTYTSANHTITKAAAATTSAYEDFLGAQEILDNDKAPQGGRVALVTPAYYNQIKLDSSFIKSGDLSQRMLLNGQVGEIDGVPVIKVPSSYMPTKTNFIITNPIVAPSPVKIAEYKIHVDPPGLSGTLVEARFYYDCFVLDMKADAIVVHKNA